MTKHVFKRLLSGLLLALTCQEGALSASLDADDIPPPAWSPIPFARPSEVASHMALQHAWPRDNVEALFADYKANAQVIRLMEPAAQSFKRSWAVYRKRFIEPKRIAAGVDFWNENQKALERAGQRFGVPAHVIVGIIGVETIYGRNTGNFQVLEALATLSFDYPRRAAYFAKELEHFLLWTKDQGIDPKPVRGSFAGAIGLPQFMPGSIRRHAVDFDGDGRIGLDEFGDSVRDPFRDADFRRQLEQRGAMDPAAMGALHRRHAAQYDAATVLGAMARAIDTAA